MSNNNTQVWTDPTTGIVYDAATMEPLPTVGADRGEKPSLPKDLAALTDEDIAATARLLGTEDEI